MLTKYGRGSQVQCVPVQYQSGNQLVGVRCTCKTKIAQLIRRIIIIDQKIVER
jgi:hypothetical protein